MSAADARPAKAMRTNAATTPHDADEATSEPYEPPTTLFEFSTSERYRPRALVARWIPRFCPAASGGDAPFLARLKQLTSDEPDADGTYSAIEDAPRKPPPRGRQAKTPEEAPNIVSKLGLTRPDDEGGRVLARPEELTVIDVWYQKRIYSISAGLRGYDFYSISAPDLYEQTISLDRVQDILDDWYLGRGPFARHGPKYSPVPTREPVFAHERSGRPNRANVSMMQSYCVDAPDAVSHLNMLVRWAICSKIKISELEEEARREAFATRRTVFGLLVHLMDARYQYDVAETGAMLHAAWRLHSARAVIKFAQENLGIPRLQAAHLEYATPVRVPG